VKDVPDGHVAVGNPARLIDRRARTAAPKPA
jgi:acetyltransferase-like isoleucine patch superfamily enzyme